MSSFRRSLALLLAVVVLFVSVQELGNIRSCPYCFGIIGGMKAGGGEYPHQALLGWNKIDGTRGYDFACGGSLISKRFVLTAAHCMAKGKPNIVRLGETDLTVKSSGERDFGIEFVKRHPDHRFSASYHDIALIKLDKPAPYSSDINPVKLGNSATLNQLTPLSVTGFGMMEDNMMSNTLRKVYLNFLNRSECQIQYSGLPKFEQGILDSQLCIGNIHDGKSRDSCQGDSGGPAQIYTSSSSYIGYYLVGIISHGANCGKGRSPSIYTRVSSYIDWIETVMKG